jgi:hypothetical protein
MKFHLLITALFSVSLACAEPQMEMHRVQATTRDPSGWYLAASTHGSFSVLIPIPFNDFTVTDDDPTAGRIKTHTVGAKSAEGIKFSATETPIIVGKSPSDLAALPQQLEKSGQTVSEIDTSPFAGYPSVSFAQLGATSGVYTRYVKTPKSLIVVILEYPLDQAKVADELKSTFLASLNLTNTEQGRGANALPRAAHD